MKLYDSRNPTMLDGPGSYRNRISPLFKWFGSKWLSAKRITAPKYSSIVEPFGGGAGYSLNHVDRDVLICETDPHLSKLWPW